MNLAQSLQTKVFKWLGDGKGMGVQAQLLHPFRGIAHPVRPSAPGRR